MTRSPGRRRYLEPDVRSPRADQAAGLRGPRAHIRGRVSRRGTCCTARAAPSDRRAARAGLDAAVRIAEPLSAVGPAGRAGDAHGVRVDLPRALDLEPDDA